MVNNAVLAFLDNRYEHTHIYVLNFPSIVNSALVSWQETHTIGESPGERRHPYRKTNTE